MNTEHRILNVLLPYHLEFLLLLAQHLNTRPVYIIFFFVFVALANKASAQYRVKGHVYDSTRTFPIERVTVQSTGGHMTMTDSTGSYAINVAEKDSIWFSYLGRPTPKYPVLKIADVMQFDLALHLKPDVMREVKIKTRNYKEDSTQNRRDYAKVFNYQKPSLGTMTSVTSSGVGFDVQEIIRLFQFRKNKSMQRFKERLEQEERDKFVDRRFNKGLVKRLTRVEKDEELTDFMRRYRPTFEFTAGTSDYDFQYFIKIAFQEYKKTKAAMPAF